MPYWAASELALEFPQPVLGQELISASTSPVNFGGLASYIAQYSSEFDAVAAAAGYSVPISSAASAYPYVQMVVGMGARAEALAEIALTPQMQDKSNRLRAAYTAALNRISDGVTILLAPRDPTGQFGRLLGRYNTDTLGPQIVASLGVVKRGYPTDF